MDFFSRIKSFGEKLGIKKTVLNPRTECIEIMRFNEDISSLLNSDTYIAKSEYVELMIEYKKSIDFFKVLQQSKMLRSFCAQNNILESDILHIIEIYDHIDEKIDEANNLFIDEHLKSEKEYFDNILKNVDPEIVLDEDQRKVVLTDEDYCLVIAGAGAGKTTTVAAKVKYIVEKREYLQKIF